MGLENSFARPEIGNFQLDLKHDPFVTAAEKEAIRLGADVETDREPSEDERRLFNRLMDWRTTEKERSQAGRDEMAIDADVRDGMQWSAEDAAVLKARGQEPVCFNRVHPFIEWLVGTERRTRTDYKVLPRTQNDTIGAQAQSDVLKYLGDINKTRFHRSRAFDDAATVGVGWLEDAANPDPTCEAVSSRYESWRNVWYDSASNEFDLTDARYIFRERWVDLDVAISMFPEKAAHLKLAAEGYDPEKERQEQFYLGTKLSDWEPYAGRTWNGFVYQTSTSMLRFGARQRVRIIEFQYRAPCSVELCVGEHQGEEFDPKNTKHGAAAATGALRIWKTSKLRMHYAMMTERGMLTQGRSPYKHDGFSLTPIWCYRRQRDNMPYGAVRGLRGIQEDINKRFARSLYRISSQQVTVDDDATDDWIEFKEQVRDPNGVVRVKRGARVEYRTDFQVAEGDMKLMQMELNLLQESGGLTNENLGRQTNAMSGRAVLARQTQGSIVTERIFDNLRMALQYQGEKQLSLVRQFMTDARVIRLTDARGNPSWLHINQVDPETQQMNDIAATQADFVVSEQDFRAGVRQAMFDTLMQLLSQFPPELAVQLLDLALEFSDVPNKDDLVKRIRKINGQPDPNAPNTPEAQAEAKAQAEAAARQAELQQRAALAEIGEKEASIELKLAQAKQALAKAAEAGGDPTAHPLYAEIQKLQGQLGDGSAQLSQLQTALKDKADDLALKADEARQRADAEKYRADQDAATRKAIAETNAQASRDAEKTRAEAVIEAAKIANEAKAVEQRMAKVADDLKAKLDQLAADMKAMEKQHAAELKEAEKRATEAAKDEGKKAREHADKQAQDAKTKAAENKAKEAGAAAAAVPAAPAPIVVQVDNSRPDREVEFKTDAQGNIVGATVKDAGSKPAGKSKPKPDGSKKP